MYKELHVILTQTRDHKPLVTLQNLPGLDSDLTPEEVRSLAAVLNAAADDCEAQPMDKRHFRPTTRSYTLMPVMNKGKAKRVASGRKSLPQVTVKKVIDVYEAAPSSSARDIAQRVGVSLAAVYHIRKGYKAGIYDRDGFRYEKPLVCV